MAGTLSSHCKGPGLIPGWGILCCVLLLGHVRLLRPCGLYPARLLCPWDSPGKNLEWVAMSSSGGSSQPRNRQLFAKELGLMCEGDPPTRGLAVWKKRISKITLT